MQSAVLPTIIPLGIQGAGQVPIEAAAGGWLSSGILKFRDRRS